MSRFFEYVLPLTALVICAAGVVLDRCIESRPTLQARGGCTTDPSEYSVAALDQRAFGEAFRVSLVIAVRYGCEHCERDMLFYRQLIRMEERGALRGHIVLVAPNNITDLREMAGREVGYSHLVPNVPLASLGVSGTPTVLGVNERKGVMRACIGEASPQVKAELLALLK